ncbi:sterol desaturase family protein [Sphingomonas asaccharolytica]|uniref:sterol desaturase family protein n=1 Tax=Sphingomonas asaccharolytica TaxID=40681 RepID=UPI00082C3B6B|nr:sterol desaturase family protein [Sphingomonas asaccharolytica]
MTDLPNLIVAEIAPLAWTWGFSFAFMTALELLLGHGEQKFASRLPGLIFWVLWLPVSRLVYAAFHALWAEIGIRPLIVLPLEFTWLGAAAIVATAVASAAIYDFFFYWCHRAEHRWLWRFHAVHHSIRDMNAVNAFHHITEPIFQTLLILLPASLIVSETGPVASLMVLLLYFQASFIHSPARLHFGPARAFFVDNRFHRIHHSLEERHFDRNFGAFTTIWDRLFGTAHFPAAAEWPDVGLAQIDQPRTVGEWISLPRRYGRQASSPLSNAVVRRS